MSTKNLGQVSGIHIGKTPPANEKLIWFDDTPSQRIHKIYDPSLGKWVVLQKDTISAITYSELVNLAKKSGLSLGSWYQIKDKANTLALAVTSTKVKYTDQLGNILIDDLGTNIQYHVTSSNLTIDEVQGVFDETNKRIVFKFDEFVPDMTADDYVLGKAKKKNVWKLAKFKLSSFLSKVTGNSITWNGGFFFNFREAVKELFDKDGGIVSKETYDSEIEEMRRDINNVGKDNQKIISNCDKAISDATKDEEIYKKKAGFVDVIGEPVDAQEGHTLQNIVNNFQRFINRFKYANGIFLSKNFSTINVNGEVNNNDTVESAIAKVKKKLSLHDTSDNIKISKGPFPVLNSTPEGITKEDSVTEAVSKLLYLVSNIGAEQLKDNIIGFDKIGKTGVLPTDILRLELTTSFDFNGAIGGVMTQGRNYEYFSTDSTYPYNPYRLTDYYNPSFPKALSFVPVTPVLPNVTNNYYAAGSMVNYKGDVNVQFIYQIPKSTYDTLYGQGYRYFKCVASSDVYGFVTDEVAVSMAMNYVNILNIKLSEATMNVSNKQHIVIKLSVTPSKTGS